jgi:iron complex outermembrane receptor protein
MTSRRLGIAAVLLLCATLPVSVPAQSQAFITGKVTHAQTGAPITGVTIRVVGGGERVAYTRRDGTYRLALTPGRHELQAASIGFVAVRHSVAVEAAQVTAHDFALQPNAVTIGEVVTLGTRRSDRTGTQSAVPVDVIPAAVMHTTGFVETWQILQRLVPSVNVPHVPLSDNHMRPVTLRGLAPDQVLVLVNGKRRHPSAMLLGGPVLNGSTPVDLNPIPLSAIERIEVLRDGAAAQYGSDAIAGVVNIVLKGGEHRDARLSAGSVFSSEGGRDFRDGEFRSVSAVYGNRFGSGGYVTITADLRDRETTNRAYPDARPQYFAGDPRNSLPPRVSSHEGNGAARDITTLLNAEFPSGDVVLYAFGGLARRDGMAPASGFRRPNETRTVRAIHPDGFLPETSSDMFDYSGATGARGVSRGWAWDLVSVIGGSSLKTGVANSNNVTLGLESPTSFYTGARRSQQWTTTLDLVRPFTVGLREPVTVAVGAEYRVDRYQIRAGDPDSYRDGGVLILDGDSAGRPGAIGAQGDLGTRPDDETSASRQNVAAYLELETRLTSRLLVDVAGRVERYSDHGSTSDGKLALRFEPVRGVALRGAAGTGFRAPSLPQSYLSTTRTIRRNVQGVTSLFLVRTLPVHSPEAQLLGAKPLQPETSTNLSAGLVVDFPNIPTITIDYFDIRVDDRIVQSGEFIAPAITRLFEENGFRGVAGGRYFTNAIDTKTRGVDVVANHGILIGQTGFLRLTAAWNASRTRVTRVSPPPPQLSAYETVLFNRAERGKFEVGQPRRTLALTANYSGKRFGVNVHNQRFGKTALLDLTDPLQDQTVRPQWITDLGVTYQVHSRLGISAGGSNLFDAYPDEWLDFKDGANAQGMSFFGIFRYPGGISPFGMNGRTVSVSATVR